MKDLPSLQRTCTTALRCLLASCPCADLLAIHSVCVAESYRRRGVASRLLRAYLAYVQCTTPQLREVRLICKAPLVPLYDQAGFAVVGPSPVVHGQEPWTEMRWAPPEDVGATAE